MKRTLAILGSFLLMTVALSETGAARADLPTPSFEAALSTPLDPGTTLTNLAGDIVSPVNRSLPPLQLEPAAISVGDGMVSATIDLRNIGPEYLSSQGILYVRVFGQDADGTTHAAYGAARVVQDTAGQFWWSQPNNTSAWLFANSVSVNAAGTRCPPQPQLPQNLGSRIPCIDYEELPAIPNPKPDLEPIEELVDDAPLPVPSLQDLPISDPTSLPETGTGDLLNLGGLAVGPSIPGDPSLPSPVAERTDTLFDDFGVYLLNSEQSRPRDRVYHCSYRIFGTYGFTSSGAPSTHARGDVSRIYASQDLRDAQLLGHDEKTSKVHTWVGVAVKIDKGFDSLSTSGGWAYRGTVETNPGFGFYGEPGDARLNLTFSSKLAVTAGGSTSYNTHLLSSVFREGFEGPETVRDSGLAEHSVALPRTGGDIRFMIDLAANMSITPPASDSAEADFLFGPSDGNYIHAGSFQDWYWTMSPGYRLGTCGS